MLQSSLPAATTSTPVYSKQFSIPSSIKATDNSLSGSFLRPPGPSYKSLLYLPYASELYVYGAEAADVLLMPIILDALYSLLTG